MKSLTCLTVAPIELTYPGVAIATTRAGGVGIGITVFTASMALHEQLEPLGIRAAARVSHSTGENASLIASETVKLIDREQPSEQMRHLNQIDRELAAQDQIAKGAIAAPLLEDPLPPPASNRIAATLAPTPALRFEPSPTEEIYDEELMFSDHSDHDMSGTPRAFLSGEERLALLYRHFRLVQEFLASQGRTTSALDRESPPLNAFPVAEELTVPTLSLDEFFPLLGTILEHDEQQLYSERRFNLSEDIFLYDHTLGGQLSQYQQDLIPLPVIPFAVSMEMLAEAAVYLTGGELVVVGIDDIRGYRWLALDRGEIAVGIQAQHLPNPDSATTAVQVRIFLLMGVNETRDRHLVFEGTVRLASEFPEAPPAIPLSVPQPAPSPWSNQQLYPTGISYGPKFQGVKHLRGWDLQGLEAELKVIPTHDFFASIGQPLFQLDTGLLDAAGQLVGYWVSEQFGSDFHVFPLQLTAFHQYEPPLPPQSSVLCRGVMRLISECQTEATFDFLDVNGRVVARLEGWQDRYFRVPHQYNQCRLHPQTAFLSQTWMQIETGLVCRRIEPLPEGFLDDSGSIWKRGLAHLMLNENEREVWYSLPEKGQRRSEWLLERIAAKDAFRQWAKQRCQLSLAPVDIEVLCDERGRPVARCPQLEAITPLPDVSISHSQGYIVAAIAPGQAQIGIDLQHTCGIQIEDLQTLAFTPQELALAPQQDPQTRLGLWAAKEAAAKAIGTGLPGHPKQWCITHISADGRQVNLSYADCTFHVHLWYSHSQVFAVCLVNGTAGYKAC